MELHVLKAGSHIKLAWEDRGTIMIDSVIVMSTNNGMIHFIHGAKPKMIEWDKVWSYEHIERMDRTIKRHHGS